MTGGFEGKVVVVTGAASGIGRAIAEQYAGAGALVALLDLDAGKAETVRASLDAKRTMAIGCDVRDPEACVQAIDAVSARWGGVDVLVNNAGVTHRSLLKSTSLEVLHRVMDVNYWGAVNCTMAALEGLVARRGQIVTISSVAGFSPLIGRCGYAASKHALHGFFDSLRSEVGPAGVGVLMVCPGFTNTAIDAHALAGDGGAAGTDKQVFGGRAAPSDVAAAILAAAARRRSRLVLSPVGKASWWLSRILPDVYGRVMRAAQSAEFEAQ